MKGFELEWESDSLGCHKGFLANWIDGKTTMALIHPHPDHEGVYVLTAAFLSDERDAAAGTLDELKELAQTNFDRGMWHAASRYVAQGHELYPAARPWSELLPLVFGESRTLPMDVIISKLAKMGVAEGNIDGMIESLQRAEGILHDEDLNFTWLRPGADLIASERARQVVVEGWTAEHDDGYDGAELIAAAIGYANAAATQVRDGCTWGELPDDWPWMPCWWKPSEDPNRNLAKAGALLAAAIDRQQRKEAR